MKKQRYHGKKHSYEMRDKSGMPVTVHSAMSMGEGYYSGPDPRARQSMEDRRMIHEDHRAVANLPQDVKYHEWPHAMYAQYPNLDDSAVGIDMQKGEDNRRLQRFERAQKY